MAALRFDTRDTKPKLRALLLLTILAATALAAALFLSENGALAACCVLAAYALGALCVLVWAFFEQIRYNPYSYNTIFYFGFALFALSVLNTHLLLAVQAERLTPPELLQILLRSARRYVLLSLPFLALFSASLCVSNLALLHKDGRRPVNLLGIVLSVLLLAGAAILVFAEAGSVWQALLLNVFSAVYLYFECMLLGTIVADAIAARHEPEKNKDFLIVLGCGIRADGTPTPLLRDRLDRALAFYERQQAETGRELTFVTSGGQGADEPISESACMKRYLLEQGIAEAQILEEDRSESTYENMLFSKKKIQAIDPNARVAFATTNYHVFRAGLFARRVKMRAVGVGAKAKWYFWPNAAVREFVGLLTKHRGKQALILDGMIAVYAALTLLAYR